MGLQANKVIKPVFEALGNTGFGKRPLVGANIAADLISEKGVIGGLGEWAFSSNNSMKQKLVRGGMLYGGAMAAGRVASGGGLYRDRNGRFNVIGVPFV
jgi:hypothetical protein